ncbi:MAG: hypothetical protein A2284_13005 [Deltaproteobacteria bacterium RIFOXYA12_FULL_61_11]|nr:MAG: hypothetical protein A2284_13005 [Deltaproteobacteria bacterium RIFOXYA12_FULL_61_11]
MKKYPDTLALGFLTLVAFLVFQSPAWAEAFDGRPRACNQNERAITKECFTWLDRYAPEDYIRDGLYHICSTVITKEVVQLPSYGTSVVLHCVTIFELGEAIGCEKINLGGTFEPDRYALSCKGKIVWEMPETGAVIFGQ